MAMIQNQEELFKKQRGQTESILAQLLKIDPDKDCDKVENGALVALESGLYYISTGMGKLSVQDKEVFALSLASPLGMAMKHKRAGEHFDFNNKSQLILQVS